MRYERKKIMINNLQIKSDGLVNALKWKKVARARNYVANTRGRLTKLENTSK